MSRLKFKQGLIKILSPVLEKRGYVFLGYYPPGKGKGSDRFGLGAANFQFYEKVCDELGMRYRIGVQLSQFAVPPFKREFRVEIRRKKDPDAPSSSGGKTLSVSLADLLRLHFHVPFCDVRYDGELYGAPPADVEPRPVLELARGDWWQFETQQEFEEKLTEVLDYLVKYGLPWLEDPRSEPLPFQGYGEPPAHKAKKEE